MGELHLQRRTTRPAWTNSETLRKLPVLLAVVETTADLDASS